MGTWCGSGVYQGVEIRAHGPLLVGRPWAQTPTTRGHISIQEVLFISYHHLVHLVHNNYVQLLHVALLTTRLPEYGAEEDHHLLASVVIMKIPCMNKSMVIMNNGQLIINSLWSNSIHEQLFIKLL